MFVLLLDKNNTPLIPINPAKARFLLKENQATILLQNPFIIKLLSDFKDENNYRFKVICNFSLYEDSVYISVISIYGHLYYNTTLDLNDPSFVDKINNIHNFILTYIYITDFYFSIKDSYIYHYNILNNKEYRNIDFPICLKSLIPLGLKKHTCELCNQEFDYKELKINKIIKAYNFDDNYYFICNRCAGKKEKELNSKHIQDIDNRFNILNSIYKLFLDVIKGE
jgi:hypothetical protein